MAQPNSALHLPFVTAPALRSGRRFIRVAFSAALLAQHYQFRSVALPLLLFGVAVTA